ncbi:MAG: hypothetical protein M1839_007009 [Geoglossum umbratile]|nr:MAG: hypothetical protein M1839_007009 [Geoglossum umbratile]
MSLDVFSPIFNAARLVDYGFRFAAAGEEIKAYRALLEGTADLLSHIKALRARLSTPLTIEAKNRFDAEICRTESALAQAQSIVCQDCTGSSKAGRLGWMFKDKIAAQAHKEVLAQRHVTLLVMSLEFALVVQPRPPHIQQLNPTVLDLLAMNGVVGDMEETRPPAYRKCIYPTYDPPRKYTLIEVNPAPFVPDSDLASMYSPTSPSLTEGGGVRFTPTAFHIPISAPLPDTAQHSDGSGSQPGLSQWLSRKHRPE